MLQPNDDAIRTWLWMRAMNSACNEIWRCCKNAAVPDEKDRRFMKFEDLLEKSYQYALDHWDETIHRASSLSGSASGENHYCTGCWINADHRGVTAEFRNRGLTVTITYSEVRHFIERLLRPPTVEERQMTMLEILSREAPNES